MKTAIIIDSSAGIKDVQNYKDLYLVPLMITKENGEQISDDAHLSHQDFYAMNKAELLKTSQSVPGVMLAKWDELLKEFDQVLCLLLSKGLSGQNNTFQMLAQEPEYVGKVFVADTNGVSIVLKKEVLEAIELREQGKTGEEIKAAIEAKNEQFNCFIIPKSLTQLVRGGRISRAAAGLAKILKITPILKYDGTIDKESKTRTFKKAIEESVDLLIKRTTNSSKDVWVSYSRTDAETIDLVKKIITDKGLNIVLFDELPNTIICHTGEETFAMAIWND